MRHPSHQAGVGDPGTYHFYPTFAGESAGSSGTPAAGNFPADMGRGCGAFGSGCDPWAGASFPTSAAMPSTAAEDMGNYVGGNVNNQETGSWDRCATCGSFYEDEEFSSATETDTGSLDEGIRAYSVVEIDGESRQDNNARENELYQDYGACQKAVATFYR